ncbi:MAG TPA: YbjN domain-containing protein, partial [Gemmatimonadaceae bacterium]|nr:YbjN domain-containing protein [Gemmatimonadaceae bacterium]
VPKDRLAGGDRPDGEAAGEWFVRALRALADPPRTCDDADERLVCAAFRDAAHLAPAIALLEREGLTGVRAGAFVDFGVIDPDRGPLAPCEWLAWRVTDDGHTIAWHAEGEEGPQWIDAEANAFEPVTRERRLRLAREDGVETWLDLGTGAVVSEPAADGEPGDDAPDAPDFPGTSEEDDEPFGDAIDDGESFGDAVPSSVEYDLDALRRRPLGVIIRDTLRENGQPVIRLSRTAFGVRVRQPRATYDLVVTFDEDTRLVGCYVTHSLAFPEARRQAIAETIARANWAIVLGSFDVDLESGTLRYRTSVDVEGGVLSPTMLHNMIAAGLFMMERHHDVLLQVAWGGMEPKEALARLAR